LNILFVTWDGPQTNYLQSLFLPIFTKLTEHGYNFSILQFSWASNSKIEKNTEICNLENINYRHINVWRKPSVSIGSMLTAFKGKRDVSKAIKDWDINVVMPRSTLPALSSILGIKNSPNIKLLFDADGLPLDERVDFTNTVPTSFVHRFLRDVETQAIIRANSVITRSKLACTILQNRAGSGTSLNKFNVVSNGRSSELFKDYSDDSKSKMRTRLGVNDKAPLIVYAGSLGPQYCMKQMLQFFVEVKEHLPLSRFLVLSGQHMPLKEILTDSDLSNNDIIFKTVEADQVGEYLSACDIGLAIRESSFSMQGVAPIKLGEYLMCGLPVIATKGIGDTDMITGDIGYLLTSNDVDNVSKSADWFVRKFNNNDFDRALNGEVGMSSFSVESSVQSYMTILKGL